MYSNFLHFRSSRIHYTSYGTGNSLLFGFHGYGESAQSFAFLETALDRDYTLVAIDLPFHGQTEWKEGLFLEPRDLLAVLEELAAILPVRKDQWTFLGYSMGGRVALHLLQLAPEKINRLLLIAPDGLRINPWYWLATQTGPGNRIFRHTMANPGWFFSLLRAGNFLKLVNPGIYKFTIRYIDDVKVRQDLYARWTTMRAFCPRLPLVREIIRARNIPVRLLYGRYDRIIRAERGERFRKGIEGQCSIQLLPTGHQLLQTGSLEALLAMLTS